MEKQAIMITLILVCRSKGKQFMSSTRSKEAIIAVITLERSPKMDTIKNTIIYTGTTLVMEFMKFCTVFFP